MTSLDGPTVVRFYPFSFDLPHNRRPGEQMPPSFSLPNHAKARPHNTTLTEETEVAYKVTASWEASNATADQAVYVDITFDSRLGTHFFSILQSGGPLHTSAGQIFLLARRVVYTAPQLARNAASKRQTRTFPLCGEYQRAGWVRTRLMEDM
jgi:hypothetical protein